MIKRGFNKLISNGYEWPPSAPEFSKLCRLSAEDFDIPDFAEVERQIIFSHREIKMDPFTYTLYRNISGKLFNIKRMPEKESRREIKRYYDKLVSHVVSGGDLISQPVLVEQKEKPFVPASKEIALDQIKKARQVLNEAKPTLLEAERARLGRGNESA